MARQQKEPDSGRPASGYRNRLSHPLAWLMIGFVLLFLAGALLQPPLETAGGMGRVILALLGTAALTVLYWTVMRFVADRRLAELSRSRALPDTAAGVALGAAVIGASVGLLVLVGAYTLRESGQGWWSALWPILVLYAFVAVFEELLFRGIVLQALERMVGSWIALVISAVAFGLVHVLGDSTPGHALVLAATGGLLLGGALLHARNLWLPIGIHFAWNSTEDILGVDGTPGLLEASTSGPAWLTGGAMHLEGSVVTVLAIITVAVLLLVGAHRRGHIMPRPQ